MTTKKTSMDTTNQQPIYIQTQQCSTDIKDITIKYITCGGHKFLLPKTVYLTEEERANSMKATIAILRALCIEVKEPGSELKLESETR